MIQKRVFGLGVIGLSLFILNCGGGGGGGDGGSGSSDILSTQGAGSETSSSVLRCSSDLNGVIIKAGQTKQFKVVLPSGFSWKPQELYDKPFTGAGGYATLSVSAIVCSGDCETKHTSSLRASDTLNPYHNIYNVTVVPSFPLNGGLDRSKTSEGNSYISGDYGKIVFKDLQTIEVDLENLINNSYLPKEKQEGFSFKIEEASATRNVVINGNDTSISDEPGSFKKINIMTCTEGRTPMFKGDALHPLSGNSMTVQYEP